MADEPNTDTSTGEPQIPETPAADTTSKAGDGEDSLPEAVKEILRKNREATRAAERARAAAEKKAKTLEDASKSEADKEKERQAQLAKDVEDLRKENLRLKIGTKTGLPASLVERLRGETEEELLEDAKSLQALLGETARAPKTGNDAGKSGRAGQPSMNDLLRAAAQGR